MILTMMSGLIRQLESLEQKYSLLHKRLHSEEKLPKKQTGMLTSISIQCMYGILLPVGSLPLTFLNAMPHVSEQSPEKNRNEIRNLLCMPHGRVKIVANYEENDT